MLLALWLGVSGVEILRRRHFLAAILAPTVLALIDLVYVLASGESQALGGVVLMLAPVAIVANLRPAFRD
jgi:predicted phage tail protein